MLCNAQLFPTEQKLIEALGSALDWCTFYEGPARQHVIDRLPGTRRAALGPRRSLAFPLSALPPPQLNAVSACDCGPRTRAA